MNKYSVGLDIGIASVGWSIVDIETKEIVDLGSRIFLSGNAARNQERRSFRGNRRLTRRRKNRLIDLKKLLERYDFPINFNENQNAYGLRVKGLTEKLTKDEISQVLHHIVKRRGISYDLGDLEDDGKSGVSDYSSAINRNRELLLTQTVGKIQKSRLDEFGQVRGQINYDETSSLLNVFPSVAYANEVNQILVKQVEYYPVIDQEFVDEAQSLIHRKREYFQGPGNEKSRTDYGIYKTDGRTLDNLFDELIGVDKINGERRASASSLTAQKYNLLNDLNNLKVPNTDNGKLTFETKSKIIESAIKADGQFGMTQIVKIIGCKKDEIKGFRIDKSENPIIHTMVGYRRFRKALAEINIEANELPDDFFDKVADILTLNTEKSEIRKQLNKIDLDISNEVKELIITKNKEFLVDGRATWHSFSYSTLHLLIPELINTTEEQMSILTRLGLMKPENEKYKGLANIPAMQITEEIYNPVVAKSAREAINVFNAIAKRVGRSNIEHVVIELPREDNEDDVKKGIIKRQKENEDEKAASDRMVLQQTSISEAELIAKYRKFKGLSQKVRFWYQQDGICPYCGKTIKAVQLINDSDSFQVDHIIPISVSFDDSQNNKVIVHSDCNQAKEKQTPLGWINNGGGFGQSKVEYIAKVKANKLYSRNKRENLLNDLNLSDIITLRGFVQRNINDTRYASRVVLNEFYKFFKSNNLPTKVKVVRGKWTSQMRKKWNGVGGLSKTRDTHHHHAIDASIIASFPLLKAFDKAIKLIDLDKETGEILKDKQDIQEAREADLLKSWAILKNKESEKLVDEIYDFPLFKQVELANDVENEKNPVKFSHKVDKKANRAVANQTIYGTRLRKTEITRRGKTEVKHEELVFGTIKNIYSIEGFDKFKKLYDESIKKNEFKFLAQEKDPKTWEKLMGIFNKYPDFEEKTLSDGKVKIISVSPFELYRRENGYVTKYAKHNNGPKVVSLKYYDSKIGSHIDITPDNAKNRVVLQSLKPWRTDVYYNPETQLYELLGLKYSDLKYNNGTYGISPEQYENLKLGRTIKSNGEIQTLGKAVISPISEFCFSLYRNDRIKIVSESGEEIELLFGSRTTSNEGYVELKPVHKIKFDSKELVAFYGQMSPSGQFVKKLARNGYKIYKINTDILGTSYYIEKESTNPQLDIKI